MDDVCYIYALYSKSECVVRYIGVSINPEKRFKAHKYSSLNKKGKEYDIYKNRWLRSTNDVCIKILFKGTSKECYILEEELICKYKESRKLVNSTLGGDKPPKLSDLDDDKYKETIEKIRTKALGRVISLESRKKMSESHKKRKSKHLFSYNKGKDNPRARKVYQYSLSGELIKVWDYANQAVLELELNRTAITDCIKGRQKTAGGFIWSLYNNTK